MKNITNFLAAGLLSLFLVLSPCHAAQTILKVGYVPTPGYFVADRPGVYRGMVFDYLEALSGYADYDLRYQPCKPDGCLEALKDGSIDVIANVLRGAGESTDADLAFSRHSVNKAQLLMVRRAGKTAGQDGSPANLGYDGSRLNVNAIADVYRESGLEYERDYALTPFKSMAVMRAAFERGEIDGIIADNADASVIPPPSQTFKASIRFAVRKDRADLLEKLDAASVRLLASEPLLRDNLFKNHLKATAPLILTNDEEAFLSAHPVIKVLGQIPYPPYFYREEGKERGIFPDILEIMARDLGIRFEYVSSDGFDDMLSRFNKGEAALIYDVHRDHNWASSINAKVTLPYLDLNYVPVTRRNTVLPAVPRVAAVKDSPYIQAVLSKIYSGDQFRFYDTPMECLKAVSEGDCDLTYDVSYTVAGSIERGELYNLFTTGYVAFSTPMAMAVSLDGDPRIIKILNKEIAHLDRNAVESAVSSRAFNVQNSHSLKSFIYHNPMEAQLILLSVLAVVLAGLGCYFYLKRQSAKRVWNEAYTDQATGFYNLRWLRKYGAGSVLEPLSRSLREGRVYVMAAAIRRLDSLYDQLSPDMLNYGLAQWLSDLKSKLPCIQCICVSGDTLNLYFIIEVGENETAHVMMHRFNEVVPICSFGDITIHLEPVAGLCRMPDVADKKALRNTIESAQMALQDALNSGTQYVVYDQEHLRLKEHNKVIEALMREALDDGEFKVWLQPKYELKSHKVVGAEALVRWDSSKLGFLMPKDFISLFEHNGFVVMLDYYMLEQVLILQRQRALEGKPIVPISVNQSGLHFTEDKYLSRMQALAEKYDLKHGTVELELTETALVDFDTKESSENARHIINALHEMGFDLSMDDFCTGYSSIAMLQNFPMDVMKIDRSMLVTAETNERASNILRSVIDMGDNLEMKVLCEGIETDTQEELLIKSGCRYGQGFHFARPMPIEDFNKFVSANDTEYKSAEG